MSGLALNIIPKCVWVCVYGPSCLPPKDSLSLSLTLSLSLAHATSLPPAALAERHSLVWQTNQKVICVHGHYATDIQLIRVCVSACVWVSEKEDERVRPIVVRRKTAFAQKKIARKLVVNMYAIDAIGILGGNKSYILYLPILFA